MALTPKVFTPRKESLFLDIESTQTFFGGEAPLLQKAHELLTQFDLTPNIVVTDHPQWAPMLSTQKQVVLPPGKSLEVLLQLPIDRLNYCGDPSKTEEQSPERASLTSFMKRVGMYQVRDFYQLSPLAINRRFGKVGIVLQQWLQAKRKVRLPSFFPLEPIEESLDNVTSEEVCSMETLLFYLRQLLVRAQARLKGRMQMAKEIKISFFLESHNDFTKTLILSEPLIEASAILKVLQEFLNGIQWDSPLQNLTLHISDTLPLVRGQLSLFDEAENRMHDMGKYVGRLQARYGATNVGIACPEQSYLPEASWKSTWPAQPPSFPKGLPTNRPLFLYTPPRPYHPNAQAQMVEAETISTEWWNNKAKRKYFISTSTQGEKLWVYWDYQQKKWFLHGTYD